MLVKINIIGEIKAGKYSIIKRFINIESNLGVEININYNNNKYSLYTWDTPGNQTILSFKNICNSTKGFVIVFDITNLDSFNKIFDKPE